MNIGIYFIKLNPTGQIYIGQSRRIRERMKQHLSELMQGIHSNSTLQALWNLYEYTDFELGTLENCALKELNLKEQEHMKKISPELLINRITPDENKYLWAGSEEDKAKFKELMLKGIERKKKELMLTEDEKRIRALDRAKITKKVCKQLIPTYGKHLKTRTTGESHTTSNWLIQNPDSTVQAIRNLSKFCRDNSLNFKSLKETMPGVLVNRGDRKRLRKFHKGYKLLRKL